MILRITRAFDVYNAGTIAGFPADQANILISKGYAEKYVEAKPELPNNKKTVQKA